MQSSSLSRPAGRASLATVFWLYGVIPSNLLWAAILLMMQHGGMVGAVRGGLLVLLVYTAWIVFAVWRAAPNVRDQRYSVLARALTVVWAINTVLLVFFLQLQLLR